MNINFTDTELQQILLAANLVNMDTTTLVHNLLVLAVEDLLDEATCTSKKEVSKLTKEDIEELINPHKSKKITPGIGSDTDKWKKLIDTGIVNKPRLGNKGAATIRHEDIPKFKKIIDQNINKLNLRNLVDLIIPSTITTFKELTKYLRQQYDLQGNIVFDNNSYELIAKDIVRYKIYPGDLHSYLHYNYPDSNVIKY